MSDFYAVFPFGTPIIQGEIEGDLTELRGYSEKVPGHLQGTHSLSNTDPRFRVLEKYPKIRDEIEHKFNDIARGLFNYDYEWFITTSWLTITSKGDRIHGHKHYNHPWSGILYHDEYYPEDLPPLIFDNPTYDSKGFQLKAYEPFNPYTANFFLHAKPRLLAFWPSDLIHSSFEFPTDFIRRSLPFNLFPRKLYSPSADSSVDIDWINDRK